MGWLITAGATKSDVIRDCIRMQGWGEGREGGAIEHCVRGNVLWTVHVIRDVATKAEVQRFIGCFLLRSDPGYGWGYKDIEESMGPCYYSCPLGYLDMVRCPEDTPSSYAKAWREKVRQYHASHIKLSDGLRLRITGSWKCHGTPITEVTVRRYGRGWRAYVATSGMPMKFPRRMLVGAEVLTNCQVAV